MRLFFNRNDGSISLELYTRQHLDAPAYAKRADASFLDVMFHRDGVAELPADPLLTFVLKADADFAGDILVTATSFTTPDDATGYYRAAVAYDAEALNDLLVDGTIGETVANQAARYALTGKALGHLVKQSDTTPSTYWVVIDIAHLADSAGWELAAQKPSVTLGGEIVLQESPGFGEESSQSFQVTVFNDYLRGGETSPTGAVPFTAGLISNRFDLTGLTGGGSTKLDGVATAPLTTGTIFGVVVSGALGFWQLTAPVTITAASVESGVHSTVTAAGHGLAAGDTAIVIGGSNSTPTIDGAQTATYIGVNTFDIPVDVTVAGTTGYFGPAEDAVLTVQPDTADSGRYWRRVL